MTPAELETGRRAYLCDELVAAARAYMERSDLVRPDRESVLAAKRLKELLDTFPNYRGQKQ